MERMTNSYPSSMPIKSSSRRVCTTFQCKPTLPRGRTIARPTGIIHRSTSKHCKDSWPNILATLTQERTYPKNITTSHVLQPHGLNAGAFCRKYNLQNPGDEYINVQE